MHLIIVQLIYIFSSYVSLFGSRILLYNLLKLNLLARTLRLIAEGLFMYIVNNYWTVTNIRSVIFSMITR